MAPKPSYLSYLGIAKETITTYLTSAVAAGATVLPVNGTSVPASSTVVIVDGALTESRAVTGGGGTNSLTVAALTNAHSANAFVVAQLTASFGPAAYLPFDADSLKIVDRYAQLEDEGLRGAMVDVFGSQQGPRSCDVSWGGDIFADTFGYLLGGMFGAVDFAGGTPNTHTFAAKNTSDGQPTPFDVWDFNAIDERVVAGTKFEELTLKLDPEGKLKYSVKGKGYASGALAAQTKSFSAITPLTGWIGTVTVAGTSTLVMVEGELTLKRNVSVIQPADGTQDPYAIFAGPLGVEGKVRFVMEDNTQLNNYLNNSQPAVVITFTRGTGATQEQLAIQMTKCNYKSAETDRSKDWVEIEASVKGIGNTTDANTAGTGYSPARAVLKNAVATGTYQ